MTRARGKMWKRVGTARRFAWAGTGARHPFPGRRGREGQKGTAALRAAPPLENPAESRLRRALRRASPRRPCAVSLAGRQGKGRSMTRARGKMWKRVGTARRFAWAGTGARHPFPGRRGREGQKGTAALRAAPPLENPAESRLGRAHREASHRRPCKTPQKARLGRAHRQASPRRPCKTPQKAASDEPLGKHRLGGPAGEARLRRAPQRPWKSPQKAASDEPIGKHRIGGPAKARGSPPRTSPSGSIAAAALQNPVEGRLRRALRRASPRRPWKSPRCSRPQRGCSRGRSPPRRRRWRRGC